MVSFCNADEAEFICTMLKVMTKHAKPESYSYGIITPYAKQRTEIQNRLAYVEKIFFFSFSMSMKKMSFNNYSYF